MKKLVIIGASGHGKVAADIAVRNGYEDIVFLDDDEKVLECSGFPVIGKTEKAQYMDGDMIVAIGNAGVRERIQSRLKTVILIHPSAVISRRVQIGSGTVVMAGAGTVVIKKINHPGTYIGVPAKEKTMSKSRLTRGGRLHNKDGRASALNAV